MCLQWGPNAWQQFARAILLVRDPDRSILAEFNRQSGGHVGFASPERYKRTKGRCKPNLIEFFTFSNETTDIYYYQLTLHFIA